MTGIYHVSFSLDDKLMDSKEFRNQLNETLAETKAAVQNSAQEFEKELNLSNIDTSTIEGKLEYTTKSLVKSFSGLGEALGSMGETMGTAISVHISGAIGTAINSLNGLTFTAELQEDGNFNIGGAMSLLDAGQNRWKVDGNDFILYSEHRGNEETRFIIEDRNKSGFSLKKDGLIMKFERKQPE
jgi:predicted regulator of Ras-like GTPase activity (Roadblock/LC7/MglB family)